MRGGGVRSGGGGGVGQGGCERRIEIFVKIKKIYILRGESGRGGVGLGGGVRVDVNGEVKFLVKIQKKNWGWGGSGRGGRVGGGGQGGCERRIEFFV